MGEVLLWSFQPATRMAELHATGRLVGAWEYVPSGSEVRPLPRSPDEGTDRAARA